MRLLLIDTCGDAGSLALAENGHVLCERTMEPRAASAHLVAEVRAALREPGWPLRSLQAIGVVNGPGSFTGVRVGLAAAKGLCEIAGIALVTVSRLEVLLAADESAADAVAVLDAGRGEFYVRSAASSEETLMTRDELLRFAAGKRVLVAEPKVLEGLSAFAMLACQPVQLSAVHALTSFLRSLQRGHEQRSGDDVAGADANYVRSARALYVAGMSKPEPQGHA